MAKYRIFTFLLMCAATAAEGFCACRAVGPSATGNGSGADWTNRMNKLPATLVRGDTYYVMDGSYGSYSFTTANSGTTRVTVKKAQTYDFGRISDGCPTDISAGWNAGTMGSGQATFTGIASTQTPQNYLTIDGNGTSTAAGCGTSPVANTSAKDCGIKLTSSSGDAGPLQLGSYDGFKNRTNGWTIRYVEWQGSGDNPSTEQNGIWCRNGCDDLLLEHVWWHESGTDFIKLPASNNAIIRYSHFKQNFDNSTNHGQFYIQEGPSSNATFYSNVVQDIQGTGYWVMITGGSMDGLYIYNNVILKTQGSSRGDTSNGLVNCINAGTRCTNVNFIGNTIVNAKGGYSSQGLGINSENNNGSSYVWQNNLFYNAGGIGFNLNGATFSQTNNSYLNSGAVSGGTATNNLTVSSGAPNPLANWPNYDFKLANQNMYWQNGVSLPSPFNTDMVGNVRPGADGDWSRGAFEYSGTQQAPPIPPSNLTAVIK